jgi:hypothetical protein
MKIRTGFVSNSSSSSFVIYGKIFTRNAFMKRFKFTKGEIRSIIEDGGLYGDIEKSMGGLEAATLDEDGREWIAGSTLRGNAKEINEITSHIDKLFGDGCRLYAGTNNYGEYTIDD